MRCFECAERFVNQRLQSGTLKPAIAQTFPLSEIVEAHRRLESNEHVGKFAEILNGTWTFPEAQLPR